MRVQSSKPSFKQAKLKVGLMANAIAVMFWLNSSTALAVTAADATSKDTSALQAQFVRAHELSKLGKIDSAVAAYESILKSKSTTSLALPELYNNLASLYAQQGRLELARQTLEDGIATNEQYKTLYENLSAIYVEMARGAYSKALNLGVAAKAVSLKTLQLEKLQIAKAEPVANAETMDTAAIQAASKEARPVMESNSMHESGIKEVGKTKDIGLDKTVVASTNKTVEMKKSFTPKQPPQIDKDEVITALHGWAAAWSAQEVDLYLSFYGKDFKPTKLSKDVWAVQRRIRLSKPRWVNVRLDQFNVQPKNSNQAIVQLVQDYRADNYHDKTKKQFVMQRTIDGWRILSEQSLAVIR